jgi:hypothetical protein
MIFVEPNQRRAFFKSKLLHLYGSKVSISFHTCIKKKNLVISHGMEHICHQGLVTNELFHCLIEFIDWKGVHVLSQYLSKHALLIVEHVLYPLLQEIEQDCPKAFKLPLIEYGVLGSFEYFTAQLKSLLNLSDQTIMELFQCFREIGHCFLILKKLECLLVIFITI